MFLPSESLLNIDLFEIEGTLRASIRYLDTEARRELGEIEEARKKPLDDEYGSTWLTSTSMSSRQAAAKRGS
jgi:hypothetical protein